MKLLIAGSLISLFGLVDIPYLTVDKERSPYFCLTSYVGKDGLYIRANPACLLPFPGPGTYKTVRLREPGFSFARFRIDGCKESQRAEVTHCPGE